MPIQPSGEILERFAAHLIAPLGGRQNLHWLVEAQGQRLVLRRWAQPADSVDYELRLLAQIAALGWPVAPVVAGPIELAGHLWTLSPLLPGEPVADKYSVAEQRGRGRLLAEFHASVIQLHSFGQREPWRRAEAILADTALDQLLADHQHERPEEIRILRWHLDRARKRAAGLALHDRAGIVVHGDFTQWNLLFQNGRLSGILDFELAHWDHRVADFALAWRGKYDHVIHAYEEVSPLDPEEWEMLTPVWWALLIDSACYNLEAGVRDDSWTIKQLLRRSPLMGPDAAEFR
jgi:aminoglycoside phosphotransferase (APT) family kinase protein